MAWPGTLSEEEQKILKTFVRQQVRPTILKIVEAANMAKNTFDTYWGQQSALFEKIDDAAVVPDESGLAGAESLTKAKILGLMPEITEMGDPSAATFPFNSQVRRNKYVPAIGGVNMIRE